MLKIDNTLKNLESRLQCCGKKVCVNNKQTKELVNVNVNFDAKELINIKFDAKEFEIEFSNAIKQFDRIKKLFSEDCYTRQAVINNLTSFELPACNCFLQFLLRNDKLDLYCFTRSSDIKRLKNDVISLSHILHEMSKMTSYNMGKIKMHITSLHKYE